MAKVVPSLCKSCFTCPHNRTRHLITYSSSCHTGKHGKGKNYKRRWKKQKKKRPQNEITLYLSLLWARVNDAERQGTTSKCSWNVTMIAHLPMPAAGLFLFNVFFLFFILVFIVISFFFPNDLNRSSAAEALLFFFCSLSSSECYFIENLHANVVIQIFIPPNCRVLVCVAFVSFPFFFLILFLVSCIKQVSVGVLWNAKWREGKWWWWPTHYVAFSHAKAIKCNHLHACSWEGDASWREKVIDAQHSNCTNVLDTKIETFYWIVLVQWSVKEVKSP